MAIVTRRYVPRAASEDDLGNNVGGTATVSQFVTGNVDAQVDDATGGIVETLDEYMASVGYAFDSVVVAPETTLMIVSPDGTIWAISVDNTGALSTAAVV